VPLRQGRKGAAGNVTTAKEFAAGAGPFPIFWFGCEPGANGIPFDVVADALEFSGVPEPMIESLILPEGFANAIQGCIGVAGGYAFQDACDFGERDVRLKQHVDMIGHDDVGVQNVAAKLSAAKDGPFGGGSYLRIRQPERSDAALVQSRIQELEALARRVVSGTAILDCVLWTRGTGSHSAKHSNRQGAIKSPGQKQGLALGMPVRKIAAVEGHDAYCGVLRWKIYSITTVGLIF
jgi:hypothetical protein